ncbi:unnamed protein product [Ascophyllum nodosum]
MSPAAFDLLVVAILVIFINGVLFCTSGLALLRVLRAAARDSYSSPRRRLLALDDSVMTRGDSGGGLVALAGAIWPWTTQKSLLAMVTLAATLRIAWTIIAMLTWDASMGVISWVVDKSVHVTFYSLDYFQAAAAFTLYTILARFWAELAYTARHGSTSGRAGGGADQYRPAWTPIFLWNMTRAVPRVASTVAFTFATVATVCMSTVWASRPTYVDEWTGFIEAGAYILASAVLITTASCAIQELRMVPIELPSRRRRVYRVTAVTGSVCVCLLVRAVVLIWMVNRAIKLTTGWDMMWVVAYMGFLDALPLAIVLMYNRVAPLSMLSIYGDRGRGRVDPRHAPPEEVPLIGGTGTTAGGDGSRGFEDGNPFVNEGS